MLTHGDGVEHGPFPFTSLVDAARQGRITDATMVRHAVITGGHWQNALSINGIADACPRLGPAGNAVPAAAPEPVRIVTKRRRRTFRTYRSWISMVVGVALPTISLLLFFGIIQRNPHLWNATADVAPSTGNQLSEQEQNSSANVRAVAPPIEEIETDGDEDLAAAPSTGSAQRQLRDSTDEIGFGSLLKDLQAPSWDDRILQLKLDLTLPTWSAPLEGARKSDTFFVREVTTSRLNLDPVSGELSFDKPTQLTFTSLHGPNGFEMELTLVENKGDQSIRLKGRVLLDGKNFRLTNLKKNAYESQRNLTATIANLNQAIEEHRRAREIKQWKGGVDLDTFNRATVTLQTTHDSILYLTQQRDNLQVQVARLNSLIEWVEELKEKGEMVICVRRPAEE